MVRKIKVIPIADTGILLQWSHVFSDMVSYLEWVIDAHRSYLLQWSHVFSDMVRKRIAKLPKPEAGFNGAMSFQTW